MYSIVYSPFHCRKSQAVRLTRVVPRWGYYTPDFCAEGTWCHSERPSTGRAQLPFRAGTPRSKEPAGPNSSPNPENFAAISPKADTWKERAQSSEWDFPKPSVRGRRLFSAARRIPAPRIPAPRIPVPHIPTPHIPAPHTPAPRIPASRIPAPRIPAPSLAAGTGKGAPRGHSPPAAPPPPYRAPRSRPAAGAAPPLPPSRAAPAAPPPPLPWRLRQAHLDQRRPTPTPPTPAPSLFQGMEHHGLVKAGEDL
ncbi:uncharacterized protein LOC128851686 [Cuculus canorus]|uniref:uncharacterized protein LOC128851686 n=1 Tax=Cuculus canorus TaxID=55661 RepID=UPI0023AAB9EE|nr:uncharacterized protein LOC128851686 [Cuculus canorus]